MQIAALVGAVIMSSAIYLGYDTYRDYKTDNICRARMHRCEDRCARDHTVGSMEHLKCNERCREDYKYCREEGP